MIVNLLTRLRLRSVLCAALLAGALPLLAVTVGAQTFEHLYGPSGVKAGAVRQGELGSCYFHSSVAALANVYPDVLTKAIAPSPQGGYLVQFATGPAETVYPEDVEFARERNFDVSEGPWVAVLLRGYAQRTLRRAMVKAVDDAPVFLALAKPVALSVLDQSGPLMLAYDRAIRVVVSQNGSFDRTSLKTQLAHQFSALGVPAAQAEAVSTVLDQVGLFEILGKVVRENGEVFGAYRAIGQGGLPARVLAAFQGTAYIGEMGKSDLMEQLQNLHAGKIAMVAGTPNSGGTPPASVIAMGSRPDWFRPGHAYTVLDYDASDNTVILRNPWGHAPDPDGVFKLPVPVFQKVYDAYFFSTAK